MRVLVLGGTSWLGHQVASTALVQGHDVVCLARGNGPVPTGATLVKADRADNEGYSRLAGEFDAAIDVARDPAHVAGAVAALEARIEHWVLVSSCSVYATHDRPGAAEDAPLLPALTTAYSDEFYGEGKVACEQALAAALTADRFLVARSGLITGPGDISDRTGYWPLRLAHPAAEGRVLAPASGAQPVQLIDVRDLADFLVLAATSRIAGTLNVSGRVTTMHDYFLDVAAVTAFSGELVLADADWLTERGVQPWAGPRSLPLWLPGAAYAGFMARSVDAAYATGLRTRDMRESITDTLAWELQAGPGRQRKAGLSAAEERELLSQLGAGN
ncbi:NAD-dependent epimerase/dehydratase family protein [Rudaeicoccus suwonensis]|uniref:Nucleoside-diphosphate-sugar epimerase n=1 Tax=Rudaeicoccus suwonensis TaxID=657409 RepID=A0A561EAX5_9MICO|nr:NAD-dependent epimerase/dehydratase family protein [Rudaeicoccus suwonensis]TWE12775.1 nucleoside-diphosphate-sugar epimerase [Rudaeicoccus suwonensis]